uniref:Uncharacterized protein n=1 Tax=Anopheles epiroticus TaxID=199890 RepID=A0A182PIU8_9DIPT
MKLPASLFAIIVILVSLLTVIVAQADDPDLEPMVCKDPNEVYEDCGPACGDRVCGRMTLHADGLAGVAVSVGVDTFATGKEDVFRRTCAPQLVN